MNFLRRNRNNNILTHFYTNLETCISLISKHLLTCTQISGSFAKLVLCWVSKNISISNFLVTKIFHSKLQNHGQYQYDSAGVARVAPMTHNLDMFGAKKRREKSEGVCGKDD